MIASKRKRRVIFAAAAVTLALGISFAALLVIDIYLHSRFQRTAGFNIWGYRGPAVGRKSADEYRVVLLGGSAAYGYGTTWDETIPAVLEQYLTGRTVGPYRRFRAINLGYNNEGAYSFKVTLKDYLSLDYDLACLYEGYNDLTGNSRKPNVSVFRHESPVFRLTGYLPIFPMVFKEKAAVMLSGNINTAYRDDAKTTFRPGVGAKTTAVLLRTAAEVGQSLERQLGRVVTEPPHQIEDASSTGCKSPWEQYCQSIGEAVDFALQHSVQVLVVTQPYGLGEYFRARHSEQQREMAGMLGRRYGNDRRVQYVNLGDSIDLGDATLSFDQMHLTAEGNKRIAVDFVQPVLEMAARRAAERR